MDKYWRRVRRALQAVNAFRQEEERKAQAKQELDQAFQASIRALKEPRRVHAVFEDQFQKIREMQAILGVEYHDVEPFNGKKTRMARRLLRGEGGEW